MEPTLEERNWAVVLHLSPLVGYFVPIAGFLIPFAVWLAKRNTSSYLDQQGKEVMNFLISILIYFAVIFVLCIIFIGLPLLFLLWVSCIVVTIIAAIRTSNGENYRYPFILRLIR